MLANKSMPFYVARKVDFILWWYDICAVNTAECSVWHFLFALLTVNLVDLENVILLELINIKSIDLVNINLIDLANINLMDWIGLG